MNHLLVTVLITLLGALVAFLSNLFLQSQNRKAAELSRIDEEKLHLIRETSERITVIERQLVVLSTQVSPLWASVQSRIADELHHPHERYAEMDTLLEKLEALDISPTETARLKELLVLRSKDMHPDISEGQRSSAGIMITVMDKVLEEAKETPPEAQAAPAPVAPTP